MTRVLLIIIALAATAAAWCNGNSGNTPTPPDYRITEAEADSIAQWEKATELPEFVYESKRRGALHVLAYVRENSALTSYSDTVRLFREKMVDFMLLPDRRVRFKGWTNPRILKSKSYYRFTDREGLDSVSDACRFYFSWSDWMGMPPTEPLPAPLRYADIATDTLRGKFSIPEVWARNDENVTVSVDVLANTASRRWTPGFTHFFRKDLDFNRFRVHYVYDNVIGDSILPQDLTSCSFSIESEGRGRSMFQFNSRNEPYFVTSDVDIYIIDRENISVSEANKWRDAKFDPEEIEILQPADAPVLPDETLALIERVNSLDKEAIRLADDADRRLISSHAWKKRPGLPRRALNYLKKITGIGL